jgi:hypothetical protein
VRNGGLTLLQGRKDDTHTGCLPFDEMRRGLDGDEEHLREGEGGSYFRALSKKLFVSPYIPEGSNSVISREPAGGCERTDEQQPPNMRARGVE